MENKKASTLAQRFGFADPELTTPAHDALMVWLDSYMPTFIEAHKPKSQDYMRPDISVNGSRYWSNDPKVAESGAAAAKKWWEDHPVSLVLSSYTATWEYPVMNGKYMVGFCDIWLHAAWRIVNAQPEINVDTFTVEREGAYRPVYEASRIKPGDGFRDALYGFEVKPAIRSIGEVIRQVRMYEEFTKGAKWFVVCPDDRFASVLQGQNIGFLKAPLNL